MSDKGNEYFSRWNKKSEKLQKKYLLNYLRHLIRLTRKTNFWERLHM